MVNVTVETVWSDLSPESPLAMVPRELWPAFLARKAEAGRAALKRSLQSDLLAACMIVCDVSEQGAWEIVGKANLADWVETELGVTPKVMADILESSKHMTYGGERLPVDRVKNELLEGSTRAAGPAEGGSDLSHGLRLPTGSNSAARLIARLKRDHPNVAAALGRGEYPSVRAAALAAGIVNPPDQLKILKRAWQAASEDQRAEFEAFIAAWRRS